MRYAEEHPGPSVGFDCRVALCFPDHMLPGSLHPCCVELVGLPCAYCSPKRKGQVSKIQHTHPRNMYTEEQIFSVTR